MNPVVSGDVRGAKIILEDEVFLALWLYSVSKSTAYGGSADWGFQAERGGTGVERVLVTVFLMVMLPLTLVFSVKTYNGLVRLRDLCAEGWSGVLRTARRRRTIVAQLVGPSGDRPESELLARMRADCARDVTVWDVGELAQAEAELSAELFSFWALDEHGADLGGGEDRERIRAALSALDSDAEMARAYYNATARDYNTRLGQFPSNVIGRAFHFGKAEYLEEV